MGTIRPETRGLAKEVRDELKKSHFPLRACHIRHIINNKFNESEHVKYWSKTNGMAGEYTFSPTLQKALLELPNVIHFNIGNHAYYKVV